MKNKINFIIIFFVLTMALGLCFALSCKEVVNTGKEDKVTETYSKDNTADVETAQNDKSGGNISSIEDVSLPSDEDIVRLFFNLINEKRIPEAIYMMTDEMIGDDSSKQAWGVQFNEIQSVGVQNIEPFNPEQWTDTKEIFKVTLEVYVSSDAKDAPIPYYGWGDNPNIRWVVLEKDSDGSWKMVL